MHLRHALASQQLYSGGAEILCDFSADQIDPRVIKSLVVVRNGRRVFVDVVREQLQRIEYAADGYANMIRIPAYRSNVVCDPTRSFGRAQLSHGGSRRLSAPPHPENWTDPSAMVHRSSSEPLENRFSTTIAPKR